MSRLPKINHQITKALADKIRSEFQMKHPGKVKRFSFDKSQVQALLDEPDCTDLAIYPAVKDDAEGSETVVLAGLDSQGQEIATVYLEEAVSCPPYC